MALAFFVLWEFAFGDTYSGRWQVFAYLVTLLAAVGAVTVFWQRFAGPLRGRTIVFAGLLVSGIAARCHSPRRAN